MPFNPSEIATVTINGMIYRDWETVMVKQAVFYPAFQARLSLSEETPYAKNWAAMRIRPGMDVQVSLAGILALDGTVYSRQVYKDARRVHVEIQAVGKSQVTATTSVTHQTFEWKKVSYDQFARSILSPVGINFYTKGGSASQMFDAIRVAPSTSIWEALDNHARQAGLALTSDVQGSIVALAGPAGGSGQVVEGQNMLIGREIIYNLSIYQGTAIGQRPGNNQTWGPQAAFKYAQEMGASSPFGGSGKMPTQIHKGETPAFPGILQGRIGTERMFNDSDQITVIATVPGWLAGGGLWGPPGAVISVVSPELVMYGGEGLQAKTVTFTQDNETGTRTTLELCNQLAMGQAGAAF